MGRKSMLPETDRACRDIAARPVFLSLTKHLFLAAIPCLQLVSEGIAGRFDFVWTETGIVCLIPFLLISEKSNSAP